jgi:hypothetical protein
LYVIFIYNCYSHVLEFFHILKVFISNSYVMILSCILVMRQECILSFILGLFLRSLRDIAVGLLYSFVVLMCYNQLSSAPCTSRLVWCFLFTFTLLDVINRQWNWEGMRHDDCYDGNDTTNINNDKNISSFHDILYVNLCMYCLLLRRKVSK